MRAGVAWWPGRRWRWAEGRWHDGGGREVANSGAAAGVVDAGGGRGESGMAEASIEESAGQHVGPGEQAWPTGRIGLAINELGRPGVE